MYILKIRYTLSTEFVQAQVYAAITIGVPVIGTTKSLELSHPDSDFHTSR
jgi:hypothetical protein